MNPSSLTDERLKRVAEKSGCTIAYAQGYCDGEQARTRNQKPSNYAQIGADDACRGYRDGFYGRPIEGSLLPKPDVNGDQPRKTQS